jgi:cell division protein FtsW (lipid II flippase)
MAVTYTTAADRDARRVTHDRFALPPFEAPLLAASALAIVLLCAAYFGAVTAPRAGTTGTGPIVNLNTVAAAASLERVLEPVFPIAEDRRFAARELFAFLVKVDDGRRRLSSVGSLARIRVPDRSAGSSRSAAARSRPLFTSGQLAEIKPSFVVRDRAAVRASLAIWAVLYLVAFHVLSWTWRMKGLRGDRVLLTAAHVLTALGFAAMVSRPDPLRDSVLFIRYAQGVTAGLGVAGLVSFINLRTGSIRALSYVPLITAFVLSLLLLSPLGSGPAGSGAKVNLGPFQPIEAIRILLALFLAGYFARNWELLRAVRSERLGTVELPSWVNLPRARYALPVFIGVAAALGLFFGQRDLGPALMLAVVFLGAYAVARGTVGMVIVGAACLAAGFYFGYRLDISSTLVDRVRIWEAPWDNIARGGDQVAQALWSLSTGAVFGTGVGLGDTHYLPAGHTDLVLAAIGEELGYAGLLVVALLYASIIGRALAIARRASTDYGFFLATLLALFIAVPVLLMASGTLGLVPLTGVVTPFLSFGGSAMVANFAALGLLASIRSDAAPAADLSVFSTPIRGLGITLAACAAALLLAAARVQVVNPDALVVKAHLGLQADEARRYQYNPRILDIARAIPRGTILDREGVLLATDDRDRIRKSAPGLLGLGVSVDAACSDSTSRCYPFGGRTFHLLGDAETRRNWSASNTAFVERDEEAQLRGFDDHQSVVSVAEKDGSPGTALRRDYRDLVPLLRHRFDPDDPAMRAAMNPNRELRLTIDARLQTRVAAILASYARKSSSGHAAAVLIDAANGDLLASVSYPWPASGVVRTDGGSPDVSDETLLDRARFGLYPPGSTFKLITAAAALRQDPAAGTRTFTCSRLPGNRVGAHVPGYARPVRDDVKDHSPHGTIDMHAAIVASCNAYFAQLAVRLGARVLLDTAGLADIPLARNNARDRIRDTLPQIGYGQGEVVASPLRMARIAAAIASDGRLRDVRVDLGAPVPATHDFLPADTARTLAQYMRDVVLDGTGRVLRDAPVAIAGKTGTAEVTGAPSHSWFIGFAPFGPAARRVAVAVILENAGYGGAGAAPAAGEILSAAAAAGLVR